MEFRLPFLRSPNAEGHAGNVWRLLASTLLVFCLLNAPFWFLSANNILIIRPVFSIDVAIPMLLMGVSPALGVVAVLVVWGFDLLQGMSILYHFKTAADLLSSFRFASTLNILGFLNWKLIGLTLPFLLSLMLSVRLASQFGARHRIAALAIVAVFIGLDSANGSASWNLFARDAFLVPANLSGSPIVNVVVGASKKLMKRPQPPQPVETRVGPFSWQEWVNRPRQENMMVVVVESLGSQKDPQLASWLQRKLLTTSVLAKYKVDVGETPAFGTTTDGELRTLCGLKGSYQGIAGYPDTSRCLPQIMAAHGYQTMAYHAFSGAMFDRVNWWPRIGLQTALFSDAFETAPRCGGAFKGVCDSFIIEQAAKALAEPKRFVYVLTLNTHLPLKPIELPPELARICRERKISESVCQLTAQHGELFDALSRLLSSTTRPVEALIVGDHAPPLIVGADLANFKVGLVPQFWLLPTNHSAP